MEIMGLVIIIILLTLGVLLVVQFVVLKPESNIRQVQTESQLAANLLNSLLQASTTCNNHQVRTLLQDCATNEEILCSGQRSCLFLNKTIFYILNQTLIEWHKAFNLSASNTRKDDFPGISFASGDCSGEKEAKFSPIQAGGKTIIVDLEICR